MNSTNRAANRLVLALVGIVLLAIGACAAAAAFIGVVAGAFADTSDAVLSTLGDMLARTPVVPGAADGAFGADVSWIPVALIAVFAVTIVLLLVFVLRQGRGHTGRVYSRESEVASAGRLLIESTVPQQALTEFLAGHPEIVSSRVSAYSVRKTPTLKVSVTCRRGVSPDDAARIVDDGLLALDSVLGVELPALVQLSGGFRAKSAKSTRLA